MNKELHHVNIGRFKVQEEEFGYATTLSIFIHINVIIITSHKLTNLQSGSLDQSQFTQTPRIPIPTISNQNTKLHPHSLLAHHYFKISRLNFISIALHFIKNWLCGSCFHQKHSLRLSRFLRLLIPL